MIIDIRLTWRDHLNTKKSEINIRFQKFNWLLGRNSRLQLKKKLLIYKMILKPVWLYGIEIWGTASNSNIQIIQRMQNKILSTFINAPWYTKNSEIHQYCDLPYITEEIQKRSIKLQEKLNAHTNQLAINLLDNIQEIRRLKRKKILDLN